MKLKITLMLSSTILLSACMTSPGYLFSFGQKDETTSEQTQQVEAEPVSEQMQALTQSCRNQENLEIAQANQKSSVLNQLELTVRSGLIDLACQLSDQQIAHLAIYIAPVDAHNQYSLQAELLHQTLLSQARILGIEVSNLAISNKQNSKLNSVLYSLPIAGNLQTHVLQLNLVSSDSQHILASKQLALGQSQLSKPAKGITLNLNQNQADHTQLNTRDQKPDSVFLKH
ncbi:hypothetical protein N7931_17625 [Catenovulum sp. 2E275]|uniref:hypothetical protein n=1 Tax=Catenovulum sp. 2E275 TaxID=2980497 RepID=UPI0021CF239F|nr:hypothetical protein [Catenovulum sp. 2E275]MCU4677446.1 hypothetical protein [Catenovulum sp. 2E275]